MVLEENGEKVTIRKVLDHGALTYRIEYYVAGVRRMKTRADESEALTDAKTVLAMLVDRAPSFHESSDATLFRAAKKALGNSGVEIDVACREYAVATLALKGHSIADAVAHFLKHAPKKAGVKMSVLVDEYIAALKGDISHEH